MDQIRDALVAAAIAARDTSYAPYSNYSVGAALWTSTGEIISGANVENASYGLTVCAERIAVFRAVTRGAGSGLRSMGGELSTIVALAVAAGPAGEPPSGGRPCGACLQVIREFAVDPPLFIVEGGGSIETRVTETKLSSLLPDPFLPPFGPTSLPKEQ